MPKAVPFHGTEPRREHSRGLAVVRREREVHMDKLVHHFREGGWGMFPTLVFGLLLLGVAVKYAVSPEKRFVPLLTGLGVLTLASGALGFVTGLITTCTAIGGGRFSDMPDVRISIVGFGESLNDFAFALIFIVLAAIAGSFGAWRLSSELSSSGKPAPV
jgi:hypothetical protein